MIQFFFFILSFLFLFRISSNFLFKSVGYYFGLDFLSCVMVLLRIWICSLIIMASYKIYKFGYYYEIFLFVLLVLLISLICAFSSLDLFRFYLFFEISLIPTLILILGWGYQPERIQAGVYLLFYTMFASLPIMISIFYLYDYFSSLCFCFLNRGIDRLILFFLINVVFLVKIPIFFVHLWLPKAHVEAPISGSIILAGIILKLGGYGMVRVIPLFLGVVSDIGYIFISIRIVGGVLVSLTCLRQRDIKALIAYSSVAHMGIVLGGIITLNFWGVCGAVTIIVAHGLCSSGIFCLANINYERLIRRRLFLNKGFIHFIPRISIWWFLFRACNMAAPPSLNLLGEVMLINRLVGWRFICIIFLSLMSFFSASYSLYLYSCRQHGKVYSGLHRFSFGCVREYLLIFLHWFPLNFLFLKGDFFSLVFYPASLR